MITFSAIAIGSPEPSAGSTSSSLFNYTTISCDNRTDIIAKLEQKFDDRYNMQDFAGVAELFEEKSLLIPRSADGYVFQSELTDYFQKAYSLAGLMHANTKPVIVIQESPQIIHEMGGIQVNNETEFLPYYVRWTKNCKTWNINFYLSVFAVPHPHPEITRL